MKKIFKISSSITSASDYSFNCEYNKNIFQLWSMMKGWGYGEDIVTCHAFHVPCRARLPSLCQVGLLRALPRHPCFTLLPFIGSLFFRFSHGITPSATCSRLAFLLNGAPPFLYAPLLTFQIFQARSPMWSHRRRHKSWGLGYQHQMILLSTHDGKLLSAHRHRSFAREPHDIVKELRRMASFATHERVCPSSLCVFSSTQNWQ